MKNNKKTGLPAYFKVKWGTLVSTLSFKLFYDKAQSSGVKKLVDKGDGEKF